MPPVSSIFYHRNHIGGRSSKGAVSLFLLSVSQVVQAEAAKSERLRLCCSIDNSGSDYHRPAFHYSQ
jgi:hypothetical protein